MRAVGPGAAAPEGSESARGSFRRRLPALATAAGLGLLATAILYGPALRFWWSWDELIYVRVALSHSPLETLFVGEAYRELSPAFFFPAVLLSFGADLGVFGLRPAWFFAHQLAAFAAALALLFLLLRRFIPAPAAVAATLLFALGPPVSGTVAELMTRHYVEGLVLALASVLLFARRLESGRTGYGLVSALAAFAAMACKEVFVPLPLVLVALPEGSLRVRLRALAPHAVGLVVYVAWRQVLLRGFTGAYASERLDLGTLLRGASLLPTQLGGTAFVSRGVPAVAAFAIAGLLAALPLLSRPRALGFAVVLSLAVAGPQLPVAERLEPRFGFLPWLLAAILSGWSASKLFDRGRLGRAAAVLLVASAAGAALAPNRAAFAELRARALRLRAEGEHFLGRLRGTDVLLSPLANPLYFQNLSWLRVEVLRAGAPGRVVYDPIGICPCDPAPRRYFRFSQASASVAEVTAEIPALCEGLEKRRDRDTPLDVRVRFDHGTISWQLGPHRNGTWSLLVGPEWMAHAVPPEGSARFGPTGDPVLRALWQAPAGALVYSPPLTIRLREEAGEARWASPP